MGKMKELWERLKAWVNGGSVKRIGYETDEQALEKYVDEEIEKAMKLLEEKSPIKDPKKEKALKAKLKAEMTKSASKLAGIEELAEEKTEEQANNEQVQSEESKDNMEKVKGARKIDPRNIGYQDRLAVLHDMKMKLYKEQKKDERGVEDLKCLEAILRLEKELLDEVEKLPEDSEEKQAFVKQREEFMKEELDAKKQAEEIYNQRNQEFANLVTEVAGLREEMEALGKQLDEGTISYEQFEEQNSKYQDELEQALEDIDELKPDKLIEDAKAIDTREIMEAKILGSDHRTRDINEATTRELQAKIKESHERDQKSKYTTESNEMYFQMRGVKEIVENLKKHLEGINEEKQELKSRVEKSDASYVELERYVDLCERAMAAETELSQYESLDETLTDRDANAATSIKGARAQIEKGAEETAEDFKEARGALDELGEEVGDDSLENPDSIEDANSDPMGIEEEYREMMGLPRVNDEIDMDAVNNYQEVQKKVVEAEREAEQSGARIRK